MKSFLARNQTTADSELALLFKRWAQSDRLLKGLSSHGVDLAYKESRLIILLYSAFLEILSW